MNTNLDVLASTIYLNFSVFSCQVSSDFVRLHINGEIAGEVLLSSLLNKDSMPNGLRKRTLVGSSGDNNLLLDTKVLPSTLSIKDQYVKVHL